MGPPELGTDWLLDLVVVGAVAEKSATISARNNIQRR